MRYPRNIPIKGRVRVCVEFLRSQGIHGKKIVDIGSTFGWLAGEIEKDGPKEYVGVEPNKPALKFARKNIKYAKFTKGSADKIRLPSGHADIATFFDVIEHVPRGTEIQALREINRVLKKNGVLLLSTPFDHFATKVLDPAWYFGHRHYSKETLEKLLDKTGFKVEKFEVKAGFTSLFYMQALYAYKWILGRSVPVFLEALDDKSYSHEGIVTIFLKARKV